MVLDASTAAFTIPGEGETGLLAARICALRSNLTTCGAADIVAAEQYGYALVTTHTHLARARNTVPRQSRLLSTGGEPGRSPANAPHHA